ncbi:NAD(P)H-dependent oxidoreductase [Variovorax sp.]|uniref:NADPH-dependent FMN reductase n=1 Tax=Variovorax sp. TaxID=1871043 RepID=UPI002D70343D|nr:NAD(P)H-dependent oxidoreductase [Variovorax sp.]HYP83941.1 NAD(P)H-dependent oxidoreductase [Variovorax sp.]
MLRIALIVGSTRAERFADLPARWIAHAAARRTDLRLETLDLRRLALPLLGEPGAQAIAAGWQRQLARFDGYVATVAEYNHGPPAALKNAFDMAREEWARKPIGFVGYGGLGAARAIEQLRNVAVELEMAPLRPAVHISGECFRQASRHGAPLEAYEELARSREALFDHLAWWGRALREARAVPDAVA